MRHAFRHSLAVATLLILAACGKSEPPPKPKAAAPASPPVQQAAPAEGGGAPLSYEANEALKERLARQEAAAKLFDKGKSTPAPAPEPAAPKAAEKPAAKEPVRTAAAPAATPRTEPAPKAPEPSAPEPAKPATPTRTDVAAAAPSTAAAAAAAKVLSRVDPDFPREAVQAGVDSGLVKARITINAAGSVSKVDIVEANPRRVFDRAVVRALSQWRFDAGAEGRTLETEVAFKR